MGDSLDIEDLESFVESVAVHHEAETSADDEVEHRLDRHQNIIHRSQLFH